MIIKDDNKFIADAIQKALAKKLVFTIENFFALQLRCWTQKIDHTENYEKKLKLIEEAASQFKKDWSNHDHPIVTKLLKSKLNYLKSCKRYINSAKLNHEF